jgi:hypothetical protein
VVVEVAEIASEINQMTLSLVVLLAFMLAFMLVVALVVVSLIWNFIIDQLSRLEAFLEHRRLMSLPIGHIESTDKNKHFMVVMSTDEHGNPTKMLTRVIWKPAYYTKDRKLFSAADWVLAEFYQKPTKEQKKYNRRYRRWCECS